MPLRNALINGAGVDGRADPVLVQAIPLLAASLV